MGSEFSLTFMLGEVQVWPHFDPHRVWIGVEWDVEESGDETETVKEYTATICLIPCLPIRFMWFK